MHAIKIRTIRALVLLAAALASPEAAAKGVSFNSLTPSQFISSCEKMGGTVSRPGTGVIRCKLPSGTVVDCSFGPDGTVCAWKGDMTTTAVKQLMGDPSPTSISPGNNSTTKPKSTDAPATVN